MKAKVESMSPMSKEQGFLNRAKKYDFCQVSQKVGKWKLKTEKIHNESRCYENIIYFIDFNF